MVVCKFDEKKFVEALELYLPSIQFNDESPFVYINKLVSNGIVPRSILLGNYKQKDLELFCKQYFLMDLHAIIEDPDFQELIFDTDTRRKIDGMALSSVFRKIDIVREFMNINPLFIEVYLDCFSDYKSINSKSSFVENYIGDEDEKNMYRLVLKNTSRNYLQVVLNVKTKEVAPQTLITEALNVVALKMRSALLANDDLAIERWTKLQVSISEKLIKMGAGNKSDIDKFLDHLRAEPTFQDPVIYKKEDLDNLVIEKQKTE